MGVVGLVSGCATPPVLPPLGGVGVTVIDRGWHTDLAIPAAAVSGPMAVVALDFPGVRFLEFGFGDRAFFMAPDETVMGMMAALFPGPGIILVTALRVPAAEAYGADHAVTLPLSAGQLAGITAFIGRALEASPGDSPHRLGDGPYPGSAFYASSETYDAFHDCNHWTLAALRSGGLPANPDGVLFAGQVMDQARRMAGQRL